MRILHVSCSPRGPLSESRRLSRSIVDRLVSDTPTAVVIDRELDEVPPVTEAYATALGYGRSRSAASIDQSVYDASELLIQELEAADCVVIGTPMHNFTVPARLKAWIDQVVRVHRTFTPTPDGKVGTLRDRPVFVAVSTGGAITGERARQPDFLTPYLEAILGVIGLKSLEFFYVEGTAAGGPVLEGARRDASARGAAASASRWTAMNARR